MRRRKKKRNLPKGEEEGEEDEVEDAPPQAPSSNAFQELMSDKDELGNVFDKESGGVRQKMTPDENAPFTAPPQGSISTEGVESEQGAPPQTGQDFSAQPPAQPPSNEGAEQQPPPATQPHKNPLLVVINKKEKHGEDNLKRKNPLKMSLTMKEGLKKLRLNNQVNLSSHSNNKELLLLEKSRQQRLHQIK